VDPFSLVMDNVEGPSLENFLSNPTSYRLGPLDWKFRIKVSPLTPPPPIRCSCPGLPLTVASDPKIAADVARAMMFLHNLTPQIVNGRLTSSNILVRPPSPSLKECGDVLRC
jgi:hypothetical protein